MAYERDLDWAVCPVQTVRVSGRVRTLTEPHPPVQPSGGAREDVAPFFKFPTPALGLVAVAVTLTLALVVVTGDVRLGVLAGASAVTAIGLRRVSQRLTFSFGEGFVPYRSDLGWPSGVQEDDDFHWSWSNGHRAG
jgi:hypothetical protein